MEEEEGRGMMKAVEDKAVYKHLEDYIDNEPYRFENGAPFIEETEAGAEE